MTTNVSFYFLKAPQNNGKLRLVCKLTATAVSKGHKVYIYTENERQGQELDQLLWTFSQFAFIPHDLLTENQTPNLEKFPVAIGSHEPPSQFNDVLISMHSEVPGFANRFQRVAEAVDADSNEQETARLRIEQYAERLATKPVSHYV